MEPDPRNPNAQEPDKRPSCYSSHLEATLGALRNAKSDTEKFAAILVLIKTIDPATISEADLSRILKSISVPFLVKLLLVTDSASGCPPEMFQSLGLQIISTFASHSDASSRLLPAIEALKPLLESQNKSLGSQVISCLNELSKHQMGCETLLQLGFCPLLAHLYIKEGTSEAFSILAAAVNCYNSDISEPWLEDLLKHGAEKFRDDQGSHKFELCHLLSSILNHCCISEGAEQTVLTHLRHGLKDMLTSRLSPEMCTAAFTLLGAVLCKYGSPFIAEWDDAQFSLAIMLAGTEVQFQLQEKPDCAILIPCYQIFEVAFQNMDVISEPRLNAVLGCINETFENVIDFMVQAAESETDESILLATARVLCAWLAEDSMCLRSQVSQVLPILLALAVEQKQMIPLLVPGLCHATADDTLRPIVVQHSFLPCLLQYVAEQWAEIGKDVSAAERLETACGIFMNLVVLEKERLFEQCDIPFSDLFVFCITNSPDVPPDYIVLKGNFIVLGLFLLQLRMKAIRFESGGNSDLFKKFLVHAVQYVKMSPKHSNEDFDEITNLQSLGAAALEDIQESDSELGVYTRNLIGEMGNISVLST